MAIARQPRPQSKTEMVCKLLYQVALERGPNAKLPTTRELCGILTTSRTTLNEALNILEMQDVLYRKQSSGIYVSPRIHRKTFYILLYSYLVMRECASPFWGMLWSLLTQEMEKRIEQRNEHYAIHLVLHAPQSGVALPEEVIRDVERKRVHGILSIGSGNEMASWLQQQQVPCITYAGFGHWNVAYDEEAQIRMAVQNLATRGCRNIGVWRAIDPHSDNSFPDVVFQSLLAEYGISFNPALMRSGFSVLDAQKIPVYQDQGYQLAKEVFGNPRTPKPDGLYIMDDMMTAGVLVALQELGLQPGRDITIATHANTGSPILYGYLDKLISLETDPAEVVNTLFALLDAVIAGNPPTEPWIFLKPRLRTTL